MRYIIGKGKMIRETKDGMLNYVEEYKYDNDSRVLERNNITYRYNSGKKKNEISQKQSYTYKYDEQDNVVEMSCPHVWI